MPSPRVELARVEADLAAARLRLARLETSAAFASPADAAELDAKIADVGATIAELEERRADLSGAALEPAAPRPPALAVPSPEYLNTRGAARLLGMSPRTLEGLRARGEGPPHIRIGKRVLYALATLRSTAK